MIGSTFTGVGSRSSRLRNQFYKHKLARYTEVRGARELKNVKWMVDALDSPAFKVRDGLLWKRKKTFGDSLQVVPESAH